MCNAHDKILFTSVLDKQKSRPINRGTVVSNKTKLILIMFVHAFLYCDAESIGISCFQTKKIQHTTTCSLVVGIFALRENSNGCKFSTKTFMNFEFFPPLGKYLVTLNMAHSFQNLQIYVTISESKSTNVT